MNNSIRRIVTGIGADGESRILLDGSSPSEITVALRPGYRVTNLWCTSRETTVDDADNIAAYQGVLPPEGGSIFRIIDVPPEPTDPEQRRIAAEATFHRIFPDAHRPSGVGKESHPGMHRTPTIDYAIVLEGEMTAILEHEETVMCTGDVLIQRATQHAWANRSGKPARIAFILLDPS